jgi:hypothetical protein
VARRQAAPDPGRGSSKSIHTSTSELHTIDVVFHF